MELPHDPVTPLPGIYLKKPETNSKEHKHLYVNSSVIYNSQNMDAAQMSISRWVDKQLWDIYTTEYLLAVKKEENFTICNSIDRPGEHYAK